MAPPRVAQLFFQYIVVLGKMEKVELVDRYIPPPYSVLCPLLVKLMFPSNVRLVLSNEQMAPPWIA